MVAATLGALQVDANAGEAFPIQSLLAAVDNHEVTVRVAKSLACAQEVLAHESFDVVLLDLSLPDTEGLDGLSQLVRRAPSTPIIVCSGAGQEALALSALHEGAQDYLIKGRTSADQLLRSIRYAIERKRCEARLVDLAMYDSLTGLANRTLLQERVVSASRRANRSEQPFALLFLDLDGFKAVNDTFGHPQGDRLLQSVAERLQAITREVDTVARLGGDEFILVLENLKAADHAAVVAQKALSSLSKPFTLDGRHVMVGASVGVSLYPADTTDLEQLLSLADAAMYQAKRGGRNQFRFHHDLIGDHDTIAQPGRRNGAAESAPATTAQDIATAQEQPARRA